MNLAEIKKAVEALSPEELTKLADFSPGGKHAAVIPKVDAEIDAGNFTPLP